MANVPPNLDCGLRAAPKRGTTSDLLSTWNDVKVGLYVDETIAGKSRVPDRKVHISNSKD
eukprot:6486337-Amphidinium_carterae.1